MISGETFWDPGKCLENQCQSYGYMTTYKERERMQSFQTVTAQVKFLVLMKPNWDLTVIIQWA